MTAAAPPISEQEVTRRIHETRLKLDKSNDLAERLRLRRDLIALQERLEECFQ